VCQNGCLSVYLQSVKKKSKVGDDSHVGLGKEVSDGKADVRRRAAFMQQPVLLS
jgi:hypothetical protein